MEITVNIKLNEFKSKKDGKVFKASSKEIKRRVKELQEDLNLEIKFERDRYDKLYDYNNFKFNEKKLLSGDRDQYAYVIGSIYGIKELVYTDNLSSYMFIDNMSVMSDKIQVNEKIVIDNNFSLSVYKYILDTIVNEDMIIPVSKQEILQQLLEIMLKYGKLDIATFTRYDEMSLYSRFIDQDLLKIGYSFDKYLSVYLSEANIQRINRDANDLISKGNINASRLLIKLIDYVNTQREDKHFFNFYLENYISCDWNAIFDILNSRYRMGKVENIVFLNSALSQFKKYYINLPFVIANTKVVQEMVVNGELIANLDLYRQLLSILDCEDLRLKINLKSLCNIGHEHAIMILDSLSDNDIYSSLNIEDVKNVILNLSSKYFNADKKMVEILLNR